MEYSIRRASLANTVPEVLQIFDTRYGYTVAEVKSTLQAWGTRGRIVYLILEAIDSVGFIVAYREVLERLYAAYMLNPQEMNLSWIILLLTYIDYVENAGQSLMTLAFENGLAEAEWFPALVSISSTANIIKWTIAKYGAFLLLALFAYKRIEGFGRVLVGRK